MADFFVDHGNTTLYTTALMATPVWGQPQDGDGTAFGGGATPACPIGSVVFSALTATPTAGSVGVLGSSAIVPAYAATADAQADNLAAAINASTLSVIFPAKAGNIASVYVKTAVYARGPTGGAPAGTCQIMSRFATDAFNTGTNIAVAAWTNVTATPADMRGGVSGPWRYFANEVALASSLSAGGFASAMLYGAFPATVMGSPVAADTIHVRTKRASANIVCVFTANAPSITSSRPGTWLFDGGVKWPGDDGVFKLSLTTTNASVAPAFWSSGGAIEGNNKRLWVLFQDAGGGYSAVSLYSTAVATSIRGVLYEISVNAGPCSTSIWNVAVDTISALRFRGCMFKISRINTYPATPPFGHSLGPNGVSLLEMEDCDIVFTGLIATPSVKIFRAVSLGYNTDTRIRNVRVYDQNNLATKFPMATWYAGASPFNMVLENVGGVSVLPADFTLGITGSSVPAVNSHMPYLQNGILSSSDGSYRMETLQGYSDWVLGAGYPTLSSFTPTGVAWSIRALWYGQYLGKTWRPFEIQSQQIWTTSSATAKTISAELLFDAAIADADIAVDKIALFVDYVAADGSNKTESTVPLNLVTSQLVTGSASWAGLTGVYAGWKPRKLSLTTTAAILQNTVVSVRIAFLEVCPTSVSGKHLFFDPEFGIA